MLKAKSKKIKADILVVLKIVLAVIIVVLTGWLAILIGTNVGGLLSRISGIRKKRVTAFVNSDGTVVGEQVNIVTNKKPLRDKGSLKLSNGDTVNLPKGIKDKDVGKVTIVKTGVYNVEKKHIVLTDVFNE